MYAVSGILFNHEGERRGETFVTRKVSRALARILVGEQEKVYLGNLDAVRDWGHAKDYVQAMYLMMQQDEPEDYVIGTGEGHTVRELCELAFAHVGLDWEPFVEVDPRYFRPTDVQDLRADPSKVMRELGWRPSISFEGLVRGMVEYDLSQVGLNLQRGEGAGRPASQSYPCMRSLESAFGSRVTAGWWECPGSAPRFGADRRADHGDLVRTGPSPAEGDAGVRSPVQAGDRPVSGGPSGGHRGQSVCSRRVPV